MDDYRRLADEIAAAIAAGRLRPGDRMPTQRAFAHRRGIAASTAGRVYAELVRRGLVVGEVGRGTFVRATGGLPGAGVPLLEPSRARIDLELNYPVVPEQSALLGAALAPLLRPDALDLALRPVRAEGTAAAREAFAALCAREGGEGEKGEDVAGEGGWAPAPEALLFTGSGRQAIAAVLAALVPPGQRLGVEELTFPVVKAVAERLGIVPVPIAMDGDGLDPAALASVHRATPLRAVYLQPRVHNPLGLSMSPARRAELGALLRQLDLPAVEDAVWSFLRPEVPPLAATAPERVVLVDSLSKRLAPGLSSGFAVVPDAYREQVAASVRAGGWLAGGFALEAAVRWIGDGTLAAIEAAKRADATERQLLARELLPDAVLRADPGSYYCWWELPTPWRAETFVAGAARAGIGLTPAAAYAVGSRVPPAAVRLGLASPPLPLLAETLSTLAHLARGGPVDQPE
ncbi:PLP-dependent aminotransferase family protein [Streptacidiphilus jiangxiensis]|uniref:DNA-binding transcriptional regulator, MocR family, contains an aminotransferase domain n=1 Tax=Streptacidiphilus jiangxiensis TaxID=235985 RepID=A0A1H7WU22_STRJI|nr:PLP-dependent aminotransferase family protein [Streptacidiphilus jiangxiensis]SEM25100.1 DNA-binding transcriptional regulator, MocR family, contains an aminotransferase domain [Streptacidiphilus jiangxiensis]